jgi:glycerate kinase
VPEQLRQADLVITGEGRLDETSFAGKVIGSLLALTEPAQTPVLAIVGTIDPASWPRLSGGLPRLQTLSLTEIFGAARSLGRTLECLTEATRIALSPGRPAD